MPIVSYTIIDVNDAGFEESSDGVTPGAWVASPELFGRDISGSPGYYQVGLRWQAINVPQGATINSAILKLRARAPNVGNITDIHGKFVGNKTANAAQWVNTSVMPLNIAQTTAKIDYDPTVWVTDDYYNIDVTTIVQEIISQGGWAALNSLAIALISDGTAGTVTTIQFWRFADGDTESNKLTIDYSSGGGGQLPFVTVIGAKRI